jgi:hypothetical protein
VRDEPLIEESPWLSADEQAQWRAAHGWHQLQRMLKDRPVMVIPPGHQETMYRWASRAYAGRELGFPVYWDPSDPGDGFVAGSTVPERAKVALIRIRATNDEASASFQRAWSSLVFEVHNLEGTLAYRELYDPETAKNLGRADWVEHAMRTEYRAVEKTRRFYFDTWEPWCRESGATALPGPWFADTFLTYQQWATTDSWRELAKFWEGEYDNEVGPDD